MRLCRSYSARIRVMFVSVAVIGITVSTLSTFSAAIAQEEEPPAVKPGEEHALLASIAGRWAAVTHFRTTPDQPATVSKGTETSRMACGRGQLEPGGRKQHAAQLDGASRLRRYSGRRFCLDGRRRFRRFLREIGHDPWK